MVDLMNLLSDVLIGGFQMLMLNDLGKNMFSYRIKTYWTRILIYGVTALVILGVNHIESTFINIMMVPVSYTIASIVIFQGSVWKKIILACCYYMLAIVPEFLFAVITGAYGVTGTENNFHSELEKLLSLLLMSTITFLLVKCVNQITRKKNYQTIENKLFTVLLTLPAATIIIFMCIYYSHISFTGVNRIMIPIGAALLLMTNRMLRALVEAGILICTNSMYSLTPKVSEIKDRDRIWDDFMDIGKQINYGTVLMQYQRESGKKILEQIRGTITGLSLFFPEGSTDVAVSAYNDNMINRSLNYVVADLINNCSRKGTAILEIGAGVGGTTTTVLENLKEKNISYCFTDVSKFFINEAKNRYSGYDFIRYNILDINKDYEMQGFKDNKYDIVLCANVLHNSQNIEVNLSKIKKLLKPNGYLIIIEATKESYLLTTSLELKGGLGGFTDHRSSGIDVFTSEEKWVELLKKAGFTYYFTLPEKKDLLCECGQSVILCQNQETIFSEKINVEAIEKHMAARLPKYMIPDQIEIIDKIPLTFNGKIDRKALNSICAERMKVKKEVIKTERFTSIEKQIADIWKEVLNIENINKKDNFYYAGGDSLLITQVVSKMRESIDGLDTVSWDELMHEALNNPTIEGIADVIEKKILKKVSKKSDRYIGKLEDSSVVIYRDKPEKRKLVQAYMHAGTGRLVDYELLIPEILSNTSDEVSVIGFMYGNYEEYLAVPVENFMKKRAEKYAKILLDMNAEQYEIIGYCVGGFLALETARILLENGANVINVVMISSELATHMISNTMITELAYGTAIGLDMKKAGYNFDKEKMKKCMESILKGEHRNIKNSELIKLSGEYKEYGELFIELLDETHEERMKCIFEKAGGDKFNGNESTFAMFKILYDIFEHTFKAMMNYRFDEVYFGKVLYLEAPTVNSFYPVTKKPTEISDICVNLTIKKVRGNHATCLCKENFKEVLGAILATL